LERKYGKTEVNAMRNVDLSEAELWDVGFNNGCDLSTVIPPQDGEHFLFHHWPQLLQEARNEVNMKWNGVFRESALLWLSTHLNMVDNQSMYLVHRRELEHPVYAGAIYDASERRTFAIELVNLLQKLERELSN
jgi:hypothetical protein